jgi:hypothetical protein
VIPTTTTKIITSIRKEDYTCKNFFFRATREEEDQNAIADADDEDDDDDTTTTTTSTAFSDDPRVFQRKQRQEVFNKMKSQQQQRERIQKIRLGEQASQAMDLPKQPLITTIAGGTSTIFAMARRIAATTTTTPSVIPPETTTIHKDSQPDPLVRQPQPRPPPRWNSHQYAASIWKNARHKYNKPAMWKHALRTFDRMLNDDASPKPQNIHYEGALAACAKLGNSQRALQIYQSIVLHNNNKKNRDPQETMQATATTVNPKTQKYGKPLDTSTTVTTSNNNNNNYGRASSIYVTENMIHSLIRACVRDAKRQSNREPLDQATAIVQSMSSLHQIGRSATHVNPLAAAYLDLGYVDTAEELLRSLPDRIGGPEAENPSQNGNFVGFFNVHDVTAKDKGSYALLVEASVSRGNYGDAVDALMDMTEKSGLYAESRHLSTWHERSSNKSR